MFRKLRHIPIAAVVFLFIAACATMVPPQGGPRDTTPPVVEECDPPNRSKNFEPGRVKITFNEFIQLSDVPNQVLISPPLKKRPMFQRRGKSVIFEIPDQLRENTTYSIFFGSSVADITENNKISNYKYTFSTGEYLDSLVYRGKAHRALSRETEAGWLVMLYKEKSDSVPMKKKPYYVAKTNKNGYYRFENLEEGSYKIFGLKDKNKNYIYDQPSEAIAFSDSLVKPFNPVDLPDSLQHDSIDTDSIRRNRMPEGTRMIFFEDADTTQDIKEAKTMNPYVYRIALKYPSRDLQIHSSNEQEMQTVFSRRRDTIHLYFSQPVKDSLFLSLEDSVYEWKDSVWIEPVEKKLKKNPINSNLEQSLIPYHQDIYINSEMPFDSLYPRKIILTGKQDSLRDTLTTEFVYTDSITRRSLKFSYDWNPDKNYTLTALPGAFRLKNDFRNDTLTYNFGIKPADNFGKIIFGLENKDPTSNYIIQVTDMDKNVIRQNLSHEGKFSEFPHLTPQKYKVRVIEDKNNNRQWDTGEYIKGNQPERSWFFEKTFNVRANWDIRETMTLY